MSHRAGMAAIAVSVLHNVGDALNSLGIASSTAYRELEALRRRCARAGGS